MISITPGCFTSRGKNLISNWTGGWLGLRSCLLPYYESKPRSSNPQLNHYVDWPIAVHVWHHVICIKLHWQKLKTLAIRSCLLKTFCVRIVTAQFFSPRILVTSLYQLQRLPRCQRQERKLCVTVPYFARKEWPCRNSQKHFQDSKWQHYKCTTQCSLPHRKAMH